MSSNKKYKKVLVVGAGAFGTSMAAVLAHNFEKVLLKVRSPDVYQSLRKGENSIYTPGTSIPSNVQASLEWAEIDEQDRGEIQLVVSALPTAAILEFFSKNQERFSHYLSQGVPFVSLSKGIDPITLELPDDLFYNLFPGHRELFLFLSGPSFAQEILKEQITLATLAGKDREQILSGLSMFESPYFKCMGSYDVKGVLLGGALKNVIAIAGGIIEGLGHNHNTRAAMITLAISEMLRFGTVFNARAETFYGFSGMGDLILTTTGGLSRNKNFGLEIAKGRGPKEIIAAQRSVVEGYKTTKAAKLISDRFKIKTRIFEGVYQVLYEERDALEVISHLMKVPTRFEID